MTRPWLIVTGDLSRTGGMDRANLALAERLADRDVPVHLVCHAADAELAAHPAVTVHRVPRPGGMHFPASFLLTRTAQSVATRLSDAVVVANGSNLRWPGLNWVHYLHAAWRESPTGYHLRAWKQRVAMRVDRKNEAAALSEARLIVCNSQQTAAQIAEHYALPEARLRVIYYGADANRCGPVIGSERGRIRRSLGLSDRQPCVMFVGALGDRRKNFDTLFAAWQRLKQDDAWRDAVLLVVGQGAQLPAWRQQTQAAGLAGSLRFLGFRDDVPELLSAADLLVHPARYEAFGLSPHEALCRGVPALITGHAGVAELLPAEWSSLLISTPNSVDELVAKLDGWRSSREHWQRSAGHLAETLRGRSWNEMADDIITVAEELSVAEMRTLSC